MKTKIILFMIIGLLSLKAQSILSIDGTATLDVSIGADFCSDSLSGTVTGNGSFCSNPTDVESESTEILPTEFSLEQNYPNPFNPSTKIKYTIPAVETHRDASLRTTLKVYDVLGNEVATLVDEYKPAGYYQVDFDASKLSSGIYLYKLQADEYISTKKMTLLK